MDRHKKTVYSARKVLSIVLESLSELEINSAVDFGCGVGTWLSVLKKWGIRDVLGLDGPWVDQDLLEISRQEFRQVTLEERINLDKKYDLAISLEVAEHISEKNAIFFVESLVSASDFILFSAAIPFQGGKNHINEQWPDYWSNLFADKGYIVLDFIRRAIWNDKQIPVWYRQNILFFVKREQMQTVKIPKLDEYSDHLPLSVVHPEIYLSKINLITSVKGSWKLFRRAIKNWIKKKISNNS